MSRTRGEGRPPAEKAGRLVVPPAVLAEQRRARRREEEEWAARSGPVTVRKAADGRTPSDTQIGQETET